MVSRLISVLSCFLIMITHIWSNEIDSLSRLGPQSTSIILQNYGEDLITRAIIAGEPVYARQNTQKAFWRRGLSPLNKMNSYLSGDSIGSLLLGRQTPALSMTPWNSSNAISIGNEVGDPLYQELRKSQPGANRTPSILLHGTQSFRWKSLGGLQTKIDLGFEQVDHMSSQSSSEKFIRLGHNRVDHKKTLDSRENAHAWFGENLPTSSMMYVDLSFESQKQYSGIAEYAHRTHFKKGFLWYRVDTAYTKWNESSLEIPFQVSQLYSQGHYKNFYYENQLVLGEYQYFDENKNFNPEIDSKIDADLDIFPEIDPKSFQQNQSRSFGLELAQGSEWQSTSRIGIYDIQIPNISISLGGLHYYDVNIAKKKDLNTSIDSVLPRLNLGFLESGYRTQTISGFYLSGDQLIGGNLDRYQADSLFTQHPKTIMSYTTTLSYASYLNKWELQSSISHNYTNSLNPLTSAKRLSGQDNYLSDYEANWLEVELENRFNFSSHNSISNRNSNRNSNRISNTVIHHNYLSFTHKYFNGLDGFKSENDQIQNQSQSPDLSSFQEAVKLGWKPMNKVQSLSQVQYEKSWGTSWSQMYMTFPQWNLYQYLHIQFDTGLSLIPIYSWSSSYHLNFYQTTIPARHQTHLKVAQSLLKNRLKLWIEMINVISDDEKLHPEANEDRFRTLIGAQFNF